MFLLMLSLKATEFISQQVRQIFFSFIVWKLLTAADSSAAENSPR